MGMFVCINLHEVKSVVYVAMTVLVSDCSHYLEISLLITPYKMLSNILVTKLSLLKDKNIGAHKCGFRRNRSTADQIFNISKTPQKTWECNETVHKIFIDFKNAYDSVRREVLYNILIEFGVPWK
jgi:hypothetical protein